MSDNRIGTLAALVLAALFLGSAPAQAEPQQCPTGATADGSGCSARFTGLSANSTDGTLTGTPVGGTAPITIFGQPDSYLRSAGFGSGAPDLVQQWDATIERVNSGKITDPGGYGQGKSEAFLPRQLNELAAQLPAGTILIRFATDDADSHILQLSSIQPVAQ